MFRTRIIYRLITILLIFALMIVGPYSFIIVKQVQKMVEQEEKAGPRLPGELSQVHKEFAEKLVDQTVPFVFYIFIMALLLSIFFLRKMLASLKNLREGSRAMKDGNLDIRLDVLAEDELGDVTRAFNDMAASLLTKTRELVRKDLYVNTMIDPLWVVDDDNRLTDINPAFTRLFGHTREEVIGASVFDFLDEKNASIIRRQLEDKREKGVSSIYELSVLSKTGVPVPVLVSGSPIYTGDRITGKIGVLKDFREQSSLRSELQQTLDYIETIMDSIPDELIVIDRNYKILMANKVATTHAEFELTGKFCYQALHGTPAPCWTEGHECPAQAVFSTGRGQKAVHQHLAQDGGMRYHEILASPVKDASGNVLQVIELLRDVTERMRNEAEIVRKNMELTVLNSISGILNRSLKPDEIFNKVLDKLIEMLSMDGGGIFFIDESTKEMGCRYHKGISDDYLKMLGRIRLGEDVPGRVAVTGQILTTSDISRDHRIEHSMVKHSGIRGYCCFPVKGKERIVGVFCLFSYNSHVFTPEEENILSAVGEMTGMALENIRLYEKMRSLYEYQRRRREDEHHQLLTLTAKLGAEVEIRDIMPQVLGLMKQTFRADFVWLLVNDPSGNLVLRSASQETGKEDHAVYNADVSSLEKYALSMKQTVAVPDILAESRFYLSPEVSSYHSAVAVPMFIGEKPVGVCALYHSLKKDSKEEDIHFLEILSNMISVAIERSEFYRRAGREKELSDAILRSVTDGIITIDTNGGVIAVNPAFERMTGISQGRSIGYPICDSFRFSDENISFRLLLGEAVEEAKQGVTVARSSVMTTLYGNKIPVAITSSPIIDRNGTVTGVVNLIRDVGREGELDRMKTEIVRSVSHEFRTPLSAIVGLTEMLLHGDVEESKVDKYLGIIRNEGLRLTKMVTELLSIARIESGKETLKFVRIDVENLLKGILETFSHLIEYKGATLAYDIHGIREMVGDEEKVKQVLINLIDNALTFSDEGCMIQVEMKRNGEMLEVTVTDTGWGIPEEDLPHLAERFYRGRHGDKVKGTGLGLALCHEIMKMHGGDMTIQSELGKGTAVKLSLPYREVV